MAKSESSIFNWAMGLNHDDLHLSISSEALIENDEANQTVTPNCSLFIPICFEGKSTLGCFEYSNWLDNSILESIDFFLF